MNESDVINYITINKISTYDVAEIAGLSQSAIYRILYKGAKMKAETFLKIRTAIENNVFDRISKYESTSNDEFSVTNAQDNNESYTVKDIEHNQSETIKMQAEHLGTLIQVNSRLSDQLIELSKIIAGMK